MTAAEAMVATTTAGFSLDLDSDGQVVIYVERPGGRLAPEVKAAIREHRDRLAAILNLRKIHAAMGLSPDDVAFVEEALLSGRITEIRIVSRPPEGPPA